MGMDKLPIDTIQNIEKQLRDDVLAKAAKRAKLDRTSLVFNFSTNLTKIC